MEHVKITEINRKNIRDQIGFQTNIGYIGQG